jgi:hypothetical protein
MLFMNNNRIITLPEAERILQFAKRIYPLLNGVYVEYGDSFAYYPNEFKITIPEEFDDEQAGMKILEHVNEEFGATIEAYMYPDEFAECDGSASIATGVYIGQQKRKTFGLCYRTALGNDVDGIDHGYKLHLIYGALAAPSEKAYSSINDSPEAITFSWEITTTPVAVAGNFKPTATVTIDSTKVSEENMAKLEAALYGTEDKEAYLPLPDEIVTLVGTAA